MIYIFLSLSFLNFFALVCLLDIFCKKLILLRFFIKIIHIPSLIFYGLYRNVGSFLFLRTKIQAICLIRGIACV